MRLLRPYGARNDNVFQRNDNVFQRNDNVFQRNYNVFQRNYNVFQRNDNVFQRNDNVFQRNDMDQATLNTAYFSIALLILAQVSRKDTMRLNTSFSAEESVVSTQK
jgi:hypothetical protein